MGRLRDRDITEEESIQDPLFDECLAGLLQDYYLREIEVRNSLLKSRGIFQKVKKSVVAKIKSFNVWMAKDKERDKLVVDDVNIFSARKMSAALIHPDPKIREKVSKFETLPAYILSPFCLKQQEQDTISELDFVTRISASREVKDMHLSQCDFLNEDAVRWYIDIELIYEKSKDYIKMEKMYKLTFKGIEILIKNSAVHKGMENKMSPNRLEKRKKNLEDLMGILERKINLYKNKYFEISWLEKIVRENHNIGASVAIANKHLPYEIVENKLNPHFRGRPNYLKMHGFYDAAIARVQKNIDEKIQEALNNGATLEDYASEEILEEFEKFERLRII